MQVMKWSVIALAVAAGTSQLAFASAQSDSKGFVEDGSLILKNRNFYYNLDDRSSNTPGKSKQSYSEEWAHAIITNFESGFTEGTVGFGVDAYGMFGVKLDSGGGRAGTGLLPADSDGGSQDNYGEAGGAVKARISNTVLKYGEMETAFPVFDTADSRLLPETTTGFLLTSNEIENLEVNAGHFTAFNNRASTNSADITSGYAGVMDGSFDFVGGSYTVNDDLSFSLYGSELEDTWRQYYGNATYGIPFSDTSSLGFNLNVYHTADHGDENLGDISATFWSLATTYSLGAHAFTVAYQRNNGDTPFDYIGGDSIYVASSYWSDFNAPNERSWQVRYDVDLGEYVVPGLKAYAAYVRGDDIESSDNAAYAAAGWSDMDDAKHFERVLGTSYTVQEGAVKDLSFTLIHNMHRGSGGQIDGDIDRVRLIVEYPLEIL